MVGGVGSLWGRGLCMDTTPRQPTKFSAQIKPLPIFRRYHMDYKVLSSIEKQIEKLPYKDCSTNITLKDDTVLTLTKQKPIKINGFSNNTAYKR